MQQMGELEVPYGTVFRGCWDDRDIDENSAANNFRGDNFLYSKEHGNCAGKLHHGIFDE